MELLLAIGVFVLVDLLAVRYGTDSRPSAVTPDERAAIYGK